MQREVAPKLWMQMPGKICRLQLDSQTCYSGCAPSTSTVSSVGLRCALLCKRHMHLLVRSVCLRRLTIEG